MFFNKWMWRKIRIENLGNSGGEFVEIFLTDSQTIIASSVGVGALDDPWKQMFLENLQVEDIILQPKDLYKPFLLGSPRTSTPTMLSYMLIYG